MVDAKYSVSWDDYRKSICNGLSGLQQRGDFVDMTLAADGHRVMAHKMVLSLVSPYIRDLISSADCPHPVIFLSVSSFYPLHPTFDENDIKKVSHQTLQAILEYAYSGEVVIATERIGEFLLACKDLRIRGLEENTMNIESGQSTLSDVDIQQINSNVELEPQIVNSTKSPSFDNDNDSANGHEDMNDSRSYKKPVSKPTSQSTSTSDAGLKFTVSNQGTAQIVLNRFLYHHRHTRKCGASLWKCFNYTHPAKNNQRCPAFVVLKDDHVVQRGRAHNHPFHDDKILKRVRVRNMFTSMTETQKMIEKKEAQKIIEKTKALNQVPELKSNSRPQGKKDPEIEYIEMPSINI